ncbi:dipeptidyl-peptidase 5 precursor [Polyplosphaeria fusca]|uniref:Dipeptidyl-peptidase V n=1 Tax=Polyplosphaeria fusca TaxID=682080 RepID=A0A9P4R4R2_9PLEO|nr:dipeptidyl-peptidase 5 precursor [Polyplosphaeria fusca]
MTIRATKFTPEVLLSAPRRSSGVPNSDASKVLYSVSTYSFSDHAKKSEIRLLDVESQQTSLISDDPGAYSPTWLGDEAILLLFVSDNGNTTVKVGNVSDFKNSSYTAGIIPGPVGDLKVHSINGTDDFALAVSAKATPDGDLFNPEKAKKPLSSGRLYNSMFVRHWDHYVTKNRNTIFLGRLSRSNVWDGKMELSALTNALNGTGLESPIEPFGGTDHFDISSSGLVFTAKDPDLDPALHTKTNIYLIAKQCLPEDCMWSNLQALPELQKVEIYGFDGASTSPVFSPDGKQIAFLSMKTDGYESDKNQIFYIPDINTSSWVVHAFPSDDGKGDWDHSPSSIIWSPDAQVLYFVAEDWGRHCLYASTFTSGLPGLTEPQMVVKGGTVSTVSPLKNGDLFISSNSLIDNSVYSLLPVSTRGDGFIYSTPCGCSNSIKQTRYISSNSKHGTSFGLKRSQVSDVWWPGATDGVEVNAWIMKPSYFNKNDTYPLAYLIHGGPQGSWGDSWSTRWNPAVFAEQGYVVVCPNPTGSTGYGQDFTDAIQGQWGGLPYQDLVRGFDWIKENLSYVDTDRAVALGASYGGYMMNWIQGHPLGRKFKALVTHDGVFSMTGQMASEELYFPFHDLKGTLWDAPQNWAEWDPSRYTKNWATPHLIIHSELDYRLTISEGLSAFNVLQSRGVESQFLTFPDENHWILKPENSMLWHETVLDFINQKVGLPKYSDMRNKTVEEPYHHVGALASGIAAVNMGRTGNTEQECRLCIPSSKSWKR